MQINSPISDIARAIQLSVAPVFLITGIGALLSVLSGRLGRTIDRSRVLHALPATDDIDDELSVLSRRAKLIYRAITPSVATGFSPSQRRAEARRHMVPFLREVFLATRALRIQPQ